MKRQTTMSAELQKVIRSRYFPTSQQMALDFIRVVLCSCCPAICGTDIDIVGIYQGDPVADGWYLRQGAGASAEVAEIVYIESDTITESRVCDSRIADYGHPNGLNSGYESPHYYNSGGDWLPMLEVGLKDLGSNDYEFKIWGVDPFPYDIAGSTILVQYSTDGGTTWIDGGTADGTSLGDTFIPVTFNTGTNTFIYRTIVTLANGCQFFNPAPTQSSSSYCIDYAVIDGGIGFNVLGTINGVNPPEQATVVATMGEPYQGVTGAYGGVYLLGGGDTFYVQVARPSTSPVTASLATVLDALGNSVPAPTQNTACELHRQIAQFTFVDADLTGIQNFTINGVNMISPDTFAINRAELADNIKTGLQLEYGFFDPNMSIYIYQLGNECFVVIDSLYDFQDLFWQDTLGNSGTATFILQ